MLTLVFHGTRRLSVEQSEPRALRTGEMRMRVHSVGLCKSDLYGYSGLNVRRQEVLAEGQTLVMGHESVGVVTEVAPGGRAIAPGMTVAVDPIEGCGRCALCAAGETNLCPDRRVYGCIPAAPGAYAETMIAPAANAVPFEGPRPTEWGALVEPLTVGAHAVRLAGGATGATALVLGGGIIGLGAALAAARSGAASVTVAEPLAERRELASSLGLGAVDPSELADSSGGFDVAFDCVARPETVAAAVRATGRKGVVMMVGIWSDEVPFPVSRIVENETRIEGSFAYAHEEFVDVARWVSTTDLDLSPIIQLRVGFGGVIDAFERYADGSLGAVRTLFQPHLQVDAAPSAPTSTSPAPPAPASTDTAPPAS